MMNSDEEALKILFRLGCQQYFQETYVSNRYLYLDILPDYLIGANYTMQIHDLKFEWDRLVFWKETDSRYILKQECTVLYQLQIDALFIPGTQQNQLKFYAESEKTSINKIGVRIIREDLEKMELLRIEREGIKKQRNLKSINELTYRNDEIGFSYFTSITRKDRLIAAPENHLGHGNMYDEIAHCHAEIEECLVNALYHYRYLVDLMGQKFVSDGTTLYYPTIGYNEQQYLFWIGFAFERLYSFWDRITFIIGNYAPEGFDLEYLSFDKYFKRVKHKIASQVAIGLNAQSLNLRWLIDFYSNDFEEITRYRHRSVHFQMTDNWQGNLTSHFTNMAKEYIANEPELAALKSEFERLPYIILKHFNLCVEGFVRTMELIDELPEKK